VELVWNNPSPNRTVYRSPVWEVIRTNGTRRVIPAHEIQAMADSKPDYGVKEVSSDLQTLSSPYFCF
jgi:hypothetical protein